MDEQIAIDAQAEMTRIKDQQGGHKAAIKKRSDTTTSEKATSKPQSNAHNTGTHAGIIRAFKPPAQIKNATNSLDVQAEDYGTSTQFTSLRQLEAARRKRQKGMEKHD